MSREKHLNHFLPFFVLYITIRVHIYILQNLELFVGVKLKFKMTNEYHQISNELLLKSLNRKQFKWESASSIRIFLYSYDGLEMKLTRRLAGSSHSCSFWVKSLTL